MKTTTQKYKNMWPGVLPQNGGNYGSQIYNQYIVNQYK